MPNMRHNHFLAFIYNALGIPVVAGVLVAMFGMKALLNQIIAAAKSFRSVSFVANALRLRCTRLN